MPSYKPPGSGNKHAQANSPAIDTGGRQVTVPIGKLAIGPALDPSNIEEQLLSASNPLPVSVPEPLQVTSDTANTVGSGEQSATLAGTAKQLAATTACVWVHIQAKQDNAGRVYVGGAGVSSTSGIALDVIGGSPAAVSLEVADLGAVWIDVDNDGDGVVYTYGAF